ncbi:Ig-like domain-containing protein [Clostridium sp. MT-14]|uniref:Ig-like domain-containing protein n=1 Tax=Clostridium sp. MT-14 TaxID=3348360 RepID=UPI0035F4BD84
MDRAIANLALYKADKDTVSNYIDNLKEALKTPTIGTYEKGVLGLLAAGKDPTNFDNINLVEKIYDYDEQTMKNGGMNIYLYALLALDAANFYVPENAVWTREKLIDAILNDPGRQNGAWYSNINQYNGGSVEYVMDPDTTAVALSALAPYYNKNKDVKSAVDSAVQKLSDVQNEDGGFTSCYGGENSNSTEMVIIGLCDNGIDPATDSRFIKNNKNPMDALLSYAVSDKSGFGVNDNETINAYATNQGLEALVSYKLLTEEKGSVYKGFYVPATSITLNESEDKLVKGGSVQLTASSLPGDDKISWSSSDNNVATVDSNGKVTAAGEGNATITAEAEDNPDVKDTCEITVVKEIVNIENLTENTSFTLGNDANIEIKASNASSTDQPVTLMVALYDDNNKGKFINHVSVSQSIKSGDSSTIDASMQIPSTGKYTLKAFVLDDKDNPLSDTIEIPIK